MKPKNDPGEIRQEIAMNSIEMMHEVWLRGMKSKKEITDIKK
jgi:hypothetical protein